MSSTDAEAGVALTDPVARHGSFITRWPFDNATPTGRISANVPANCGTPRSNVSVPSTLVVSGRFCGSTPSLILKPLSSSAWPPDMR